MKLALMHFREENPFNCAICSMKSVLTYYNIPVKSCDIESSMKCSIVGTNIREIERFLRRHGLMLKPVANHLQLGWFLNNRIPVLAKRHLYRILPHYCVISGIENNTIILDDPYFSEPRRVNYQKLKELEMYAVVKKEPVQQKAD